MQTGRWSVFKIKKYKSVIEEDEIVTVTKHVMDGLVAVRAGG